MTRTTKAQIQKELDKKGISYSSQSTKDELEDLLEKAEGDKAQEKVEKKSKKAEVEKIAYYNGVKIKKTNELVDKEGNPQVRVSLLSGEVKVVPPELYKKNLSYK